MIAADADDDGKVRFIRCEVLRETDRAYLLDVCGRQGWVPKSQVRQVEARGGCRMPSWLAKKHRWGAE
jgi:hypothetical protein